MDLSALGNNIDLAQKTLDTLWLRQQAISDNIANADTPGYKAKSVKFEEYLHSATGKSGVASLKAVVTQDNSTTMKEDGNNVDIDEQNIELARTILEYEYMIQSLSSELSRMKYAVTEGKG